MDLPHFSSTRLTLDHSLRHQELTIKTIPRMLNTFENADTQHRRRLERERHLQMMDQATTANVAEEEEEEAGPGVVGEGFSGSLVVGQEGEANFKNVNCFSRLKTKKVAILVAATVLLAVVISMILSSQSSHYENTNGPPIFDESSPSNKDGDSDQEVKYHKIYSMILEWNVTPHEVLEESNTAANRALQWLAYEDEFDSWNEPEVYRGRYALAVLYFSNKASWISDIHWMSAYPVCFWHGISCQDDDEIVGLVQAVNLTANGLKGGVIPSELALLGNTLEFLDLSGNDIQGTIPDLSALQNLQYLCTFTFCFREHSFECTFSSELVPNSFTLADLGPNDISGSIPSSVYVLPHLTHLYLSDCKLSGPISDEIGQLSNLLILGLQNNMLTGPIPSAIGHLTNLRALYLDKNALTSAIPTSLGALSRLVDMRIGQNHLKGTIPTELSSLRLLQIFFADSNSFTGGIPGSTLSSLPLMRELHLQNNKLSGPIPAAMGSLELLNVLYLDQNLLTGLIPPSIGALYFLESLYIGNNKLKGSIPSELTHLSSLKHLRLENNTITGPVPPQLLANLKYLLTFHAHGNNLSGTITCSSVPKDLFDFTSDCFSKNLSCECCTECHP